MAILAIDQGQTKTIVMLAKENGEILGTGMAAGASHFKEGLKKASDMIRAAAEDAFRRTGLTYSDITEVWGGIAGANWPDEVETLETEIRRIFFAEKVRVYNDCVIALRAGTDSDNAIVLCTGSGMNSAVFVKGKLELLYNNYIDLQDQGSEGLGARAFRSAFQSHMHYKEATTLGQRLCDYFEIQDMDKLMLAFYRNQLPKPLKNVAQIVFEEAAHNEPAALEAIYSFGKSISQYVIGAVRRFQVVSADFTVILTGGVFKNENPLLYETVCSQIHRVYADIKIEQSFYEPIVGAVLLALDEKGAKHDEAHKRCKQSSTAQGIVRY